MKYRFLSFAFAAAAFSFAGSVWVGYDGGLAEYDERGDLVKRFDAYRKPVSLQIDAARGRLWFIDAYDYSLVCLDFAAGRELVRVDEAAHAAGVAGGDLKVYLLETRPVEPSLSLDAGDGSVWLADFYGHELARYDAAGTLLFRVAGVHEPFAVAALGDGRAWVSAGIRSLALVAPDGKTEREQGGVNEARALAYDPAASLVWVADYRNNRVLAMAPDATLKKRVVGVELPCALAVDGAGGVVWVATQYEGVKKITAAEGTVAAEITTPERPAALAADGNGRLWAVYGAEGAAVCYDRAGEEVLRIPGLNQPTGVAAR
jgi:sugar lactone lactonase YvrE